MNVWTVVNYFFQRGVGIGFARSVLKGQKDGFLVIDNFSFYFFVIFMVEKVR